MTMSVADCRSQGAARGVPSSTDHGIGGVRVAANFAPGPILPPVSGLGGSFPRVEPRGHLPQAFCWDFRVRVSVFSPDLVSLRGSLAFMPPACSPSCSARIPRAPPSDAIVRHSFLHQKHPHGGTRLSTVFSTFIPPPKAPLETLRVFPVLFPHSLFPFQKCVCLSRPCVSAEAEGGGVQPGSRLGARFPPLPSPPQRPETPHHCPCSMVEWAKPPVFFPGRQGPNPQAESHPPPHSPSGVRPQLIALAETARRTAAAAADRTGVFWGGGRVCFFLKGREVKYLMPREGEFGRFQTSGKTFYR